MTLPLIHTLQKCTSQERRRLEKVFFSDTITRDDFLLVSGMITRHGGTDYTVGRARAFAEQAKGCLSSFAPSGAKKAILALADHVIERKN